MRVIDDNFLLKIDSTLFAFYSNLFYRFGTLLKECDVSGTKYGYQNEPVYSGYFNFK